MENKKQLGGKRKGAGRKPVLNKKKQISLYVEGNKVIKFGSEEKMKEHLYSIIETFGNEPISFVPQTEVNFHGNPIPVSVVDKVEVKSEITGLSPKLSDFDKFSEELYGAKSKAEVEAIMKRSVGGAMFPKDRIALKAVADEVMEDMFND